MRTWFYAIAFGAWMLLASPLRAQSTDQKLPWQIGSSALAGKQTLPVIFLSPEQITVPANRPALVDLHFRIADGMHINSHAPHDNSLISTQVIVAESSGLTISGIDFPVGTDATLDFAPQQKFNIYNGEFVLHAHVTVKPGERLFQGFMRYQACDNSECLPPRKVPFAVDVLAK